VGLLRSPWSALGAVLLGAALTAPAGPAGAQDTLPPHQGGWVRSLGLPDRDYRYLALSLGLDRLDGEYLGAQARAGIIRPLGSPVTNLLAVQVEAYGGIRDTRPGWGVRPALVSWVAGLGAGLDLDGADGRVDPVLFVHSPVRRGGLAGHGSGLRIEWYPTRNHGLGAAVVRPLGWHHGRTRPRHDRVHLRAHVPRPIEFTPDQDMVRTLDELAESAARINRFTLVPLGRRGHPGGAEMARDLALVRHQLSERSVDEEVRRYHHLAELAFSMAVSEDPWPTPGVTPLGAEVAAAARRLLLENVIFPYNRLLGQQKEEDTTREFALHARGAFARWLIRTSSVPPARTEATMFAFQAWLDIVEATRAANRAAWRESRLVWLPLQLALRPQDYAAQEALDTLVSHAVGRRVQHGNRIWYVYNDRFVVQLVESIREARDYHVLWVHDFRGLTQDKQPDRSSLLTVTQSYLAALTRAVEAYDSVGRLPVYMLFLDQHYFELSASRHLLHLLQDPIHHRLRLPGLSPAMADTIAAWQAELGRAVGFSQLLAAERAEYGERWLRRLVKVHVSVTNPVDPSFRSAHILGFLGVPDDYMRDHRKAVLYDVGEEDPYRGMAFYAGHGVGEAYASPAWEDRAIMIQGPMALTLRDAARRLLEVQGFGQSEIPHVLRPRPRPPDYDARVQMEIDSMDAWGGVATRALELHNATGFGPKEIAVAQATVFNLTSPGAVLKVPDSIWMNELLASLLSGAALRGTRVMPIAPSAASAPAPTMALPGMRLVFTKLLAVGLALAPEMQSAGGFLRPGFYHADVQVHDLAFRLQSLRRSLETHAFLRELYPSLHHAFQELAATDGVGRDGPGDQDHQRLASSRVEPEALQHLPVTGAFAKLHFKGFLYVSAEAWSSLIAAEPLITGLMVYLEERAHQLREGAGAAESEMAEALQVLGADLINPVLDRITEEERARWAFFLQIGSPNLDYRSMLLDGEVAVLVSGWTSLYGALDFLLLTGLVTWVDTQAQIDELIPPAGRLKRTITRWISLGL
jgi:phosphatidylserine/phosphatidylglycerophosphate/cardiolipin synthase-like enzyme